ncbi:hypothetical protein P170DRAFT_429073 [Aspergillus steynii IBT 23096]|uniref:Uncharacterized protein n=1 Tax=Aspergillus steynii IBT 23096 TaxID=1392250 RepID=A0A2I2FZB2_9EURO|nr:uncharacterized protein P170DRAFT_429073 [Aspergillus steynii IBT 23096]PLB45896.1 hypothetical protein P170DRAFT_429073 [Aspergillus steynii IBT 23096]
MTATLNGMYNTAPDTPSPVYPDRLIRPLPKRTLRSRLSSDAADTILYPPTPPATQLFYGSGADSGEAVNESKIYVQQSDGPDQTLERDPHLLYENGVDFESGDEDGPVVVRRSAGFRGSSLSPSAPPQPLPSNGEGPPTKSAGPDGYDAFENTNNKKKRKIPTPGSLGSHHSTLSPEFSNMGLTSSAQTPPAQMDGSHVSTFYGTGSPASPVASGNSGSGRGRLARHPPRNGPGRAPPTAVHAQAGMPQGRVAGRRDGQMSSPGPAGDPAPKSEQGIISAAIANAAAAAFSSPPRPDNASMLEQRQPTTPTKTQFTFTCESDSSKGMAMQAQNTYPAQNRSPRSPRSLTPTASNSRAFSTQGTQTSPPVASHMNPPAANAEPPPADRKKKRSPGSIYALAARGRKVQQQYTNLQHPPGLEDIWICEFCEYESIFGRPPEALIRQYEIKDRKERKRLAEKKRLLEKAKMKGRKNKKATKNAAKNSSAQPAAYEPGYDRTSADHSSMGPHGGHEDDESLANDPEDESIAAPPPGPPPAAFKSPVPPGPPKLASGVKGAADGGTNRPP